MIFSLEALRAAHGDSLILHYGDPGKPRFVVIDGGPVGVYADALRPRLGKLAKRWAAGDKLALDAVMVSHMDDDHIHGILDLTQDLISTQGTQSSPFRVGTLWHNSFEDVVGAANASAVASAVTGAPATIASAGPSAPAWTGTSQAVIASVSQARDLRDNARGLDWDLNTGFGGGLVAAPDSGGQVVTHGPLTLTIVGPLQQQVAKLHAKWQEQVAKLKQAKSAKEAAEVADYLDRSVYNLSSIVCLAELGGKRILLTGDALGSLVLDGLERAGLTREGRIKVDVLKLPHHGSSRNVKQEFFERIHADHYVISGNGKYDNPEVATLQMISAARTDTDDFTIHLTYEHFSGPTEAKIQQFLTAEKAKGRTYKVQRRPAADLSLRVDLLDPVDY